MDVQESIPFPYAPSRFQEHPCSAWNASMPAFPLFKRVDIQQVVFVRTDFARDVDHTRRSDELRCRNRVGGVVLEITAGDPMHGRIEVRTGVFAHADRVPVPGWPLVCLLYTSP